MTNTEDFASYLEPFLFFASELPNGLAIICNEEKKVDLALAKIIKLQTDWDILYITDEPVCDINIDYTVNNKNIKKFISTITSNSEVQRK